MKHVILLGMCVGTVFVRLRLKAWTFAWACLLMRAGVLLGLDVRVTDGMTTGVGLLRVCGKELSWLRICRCRDLMVALWCVVVLP